MRTRAHREKVENMIKDFKKMRMDRNSNPYDLNDFVNYIIDVHSRIQQIIWKGGLIREYDKYVTLRSVLSEFHHKRILDYLWDKETGVKEYKSVVKKFVLEYLSCGVDNIKYYTNSYKLRSGRRIKSNFKLMPNISYELSRELYDKFISSISIHFQWV